MLGPDLLTTHRGRADSLEDAVERYYKSLSKWALTVAGDVDLTDSVCIGEPWAFGLGELYRVNGALQRL